MKGERQMKKRILAIILTVMMVFSLLPAVSPPAQAAEGGGNNPLDTIRPSDFHDVNPYGYEPGQPFLLTESNELMLYNTRDQDASGGGTRGLHRFDNLPHTGSGETEKYGSYSGTLANSNMGANMTGPNGAVYSYVQAVAFDPTGSGRKDHVAFVGVKPYQTDSDGDPLYGAYVWVVNAATGAVSYPHNANVHHLLTSTRWVEESGLYQYEAGNFFAITAGDYDGDNKDSIVIYVAGDHNGGTDTDRYNAGAKLYEYSLNVNAGVVSFQGDGWPQSTSNALLHSSYCNTTGAERLYFGGNGSEDNDDDSDFGEKENKLSVALATGDFNGDGIDDLGVLSHINRGTKEDLPLEYIKAQLRTAMGTKNGGVILDNTPSTHVIFSQESVTSGNNYNTMYSLAAGNLAAGDINNDGYDDLVVAGVQTKSDPQSGSNFYAVDDWFNIASNVPLYVQSFHGAKGAATMAANNPVIDLPSNDWTDAGFYEGEDDVWPKLGLACVAINGNAAAEAVFISGALYNMDGKTPISNTNNKLHQPSYFDNADDAVGSNIITNTYISSVAAGNFDNNMAGREQVIFVAGLKKKSSRDNYFFMGAIGGTRYADTKTGDTITKFGASAGYWSTTDSREVFDSVSDFFNSGGSDDAAQGLNCIVIAADYDTDGVMVKYKGAGYAYTDPSVVAVLQAAPYFGELMDSGNNETSYSISTSYEYSTSSSHNVSFSAGVSTTIPLAPMVSMSIETGYTMDWSDSFEETLVEEKTVTFTTENYNQVVVKRTPVAIYTFQLPENNGTFAVKPAQTRLMTLNIPLAPTYYQLSVDGYNTFADTYNSLIGSDGTKLEKIDKAKDFLANNEGNPWGYLQNPFASINSIIQNSGKDLSTSVTPLGKDGGRTGVDWTHVTEATTSTDMSHGFYFNYEIKYGSDDVAGGAASTSLNYSNGKGYSETKGTSHGKNCVVQNIDGPGLLEAGVPQAVIDGYNFSWALGTWSRNMGGSATVPTPFIGYRLENLSSPPLSVKDLHGVAIGTDQAELRWTKPTTPAGWPEIGGYNVYKVDEGNYTKLNASPLAAAATSHKVTGLESNSAHTFVVTSLASGRESIWSNEAVVTTPKASYTVTLALDDPTAATMTAYHLGNVPINSGEKITEGDVVNISATRTDPGYEILGLTATTGDTTITIEPTADKSSVSYDFTITGDTTIEIETKRMVTSSAVTFAAAPSSGSLTATVNGLPFAAPGGTVTMPVTFTAAADSGYALKEWQITDASGPIRTLPGTNPYTLYLTSTSHNVVPVFVSADQVTHHIITVQQPPEGGRIKLMVGDGELIPGADGNVRVATNTEVTFIAEPAVGCQFSNGWTDAAAGQPATFTRVITEAITVGVNFSIPAKYDVTYGVGSNGTTGQLTASPLPYNGKLPGQTPLTFTARAGAGERVEKWVITEGGAARTINTDDALYDSSTSNVQEFALSADTNVLVYFKDIEDCLITVYQSGNGTVTLKKNGADAISSGDRVNFFDSVTATATPAYGYTFDNTDNWTDNGNGSYSKTFSDIKKNLDIPVTFTAIQTCTVNITQPDPAAGSIAVVNTSNNDATVNNGDQVPSGANLKVTVTVNEGYELAGFPGIVGGSANKTYTYNISNVQAAQNISATIHQKPVITIGSYTGITLAVTGTRYGTKNTTISTGQYVDYDTDVTAIATPAYGYSFNTAGWTPLTGGQYSKTFSGVTADKDIEVTFDAITPCTVNIPSVSGANIEVVNTSNNDAPVTDSSTVPQGADLKVTVTVYEGYELEREGDTAIHGSTAGATHTYTIEKVQGTQNITPTIHKKPVVTIANASGVTFTVTGTRDGTEGTRISSGQYVDYNTDVTAEATLAYGFSADMAGWTDEGNGHYSRTYPNIKGDRTIDVTSGETKFGVTITQPDPAAGSIAVVDVDSSRTVQNGDEVLLDTKLQVTITINAGYELKDHAGITTGSYVYTIDQVQSDQTFAPVINKKPELTITVDPDTGGDVEVTGTQYGNATTFVPGAQLVDFNTDVDLSIRPATGYVVKSPAAGWTAGSGDNADDYSHTFTGVKTDTSIDTGFTALGVRTVTYSVVKTDDFNGLISAAAERRSMADYAQSDASGLTGDSKTVYEGGSVTFTAAPNGSYCVQEWRINGNIVNGNTTNTLTLTYAELAGDDNVTVQFTQDLNTVTFQQPANGTLTATAAGMPFTSGGSATSEVTFTATPDANYEIARWLVDGVEKQTGGDTFKITATKSITVEVEILGMALNVTATANAGGAVSGLPNEVRYGDKITLTATHDGGFSFVGWYLDDVQVDANTAYTFTATQNGAYEARFDPGDAIYTITLSPTVNGAITATVNGESVTEAAAGTLVTFTATPAPAYQLSAWTGDAAGKTGSVFTMTITKDVTVGAAFAGAVFYYVTYDLEGTGGEVSAKVGAADLPRGYRARQVGNSAIDFTAVPDNGYMVDQWTVNGAVVTAGTTKYGYTTVSQENPHSNRFTVTALTEELVVKVSFKPYAGYAIPAGGPGYTVADVVRTPAVTYAGAPADEICEGGDLTFTFRLDADATLFTKMNIGGYDFLGGGTNGSTGAVKNNDGSYTVTVANVNANIVTDASANQVAVGPLTVPAALASNEDLDTTDEIQTALRAKIAYFTSYAYYDIALKYKNGGGWVEVDESVFPASGVDVLLSYEILKIQLGDGVDSGDSFAVAHILTTQSNAGEIETFTGTQMTRSVDGISFHVNSMSPFAVGWTNYVASSGGVGAGGGGGGGGGGGEAAPTATAVITESAPTISGTTASASVQAEEVDAAVNSALQAAQNSGAAPKLEVDVVVPANTDSVTVTLPAAALATLSSHEDAELTIASDVGGVTLDSAALNAVAEQAGENITVSIEPVPASRLTEEQQTVVGDAPVFDVSIISDGRSISGLGGGTAKVSVPYELPAGQDPKGVVVYFLDDEGQLHKCDTVYDPVTKAVTFVTVHFSKYVIGYDETLVWANPFTDVSAGDWFYTSVTAVVQAGLFEGTSATAFEPQTPMTRAMFVTVLWRLAGEPGADSRTNFTDVATGAWYAAAVGWAAMNEIVTGTGESIFSPDDVINREQIAAILYRYHNGAPATAVSFNDAADISAWAAEAVGWASEQKLLTGYPDGSFKPQNTATRAEVATVFSRVQGSGDRV